MTTVDEPAWMAEAVEAARWAACDHIRRTEYLARPCLECRLRAAAPIIRRAVLEEAAKEIEQLKAKLRRSQIYGLSGRCRGCGGREGDHRMSCQHYVGPLRHRWVRTGWNGTFGGVDHFCECGGWFRLGGLAGHGDGTEAAEPVCPNATEEWRGDRAKGGSE